MLHIVALAWIYVAGMAALVEALSPQGTLLGALLTLVGWGLVPLALVLYILGTPARRRRRRAADAAAASGTDPDRGGHAPGEAVAPEREEP
jgi:Zn-dependent protease with chaperone function